MHYLTHATVGANVIWLSLLADTIDERIIILGAAGAIAALLPDIDATAAKIHFLGGGVLGVFRGGFIHRGFFHSLLAGVAVFILSFIFLRHYQPLLPLAIALGYISHPFIDGLNYGGVQYFFPYRKKFHILPKFLRTPVEGLTDRLLLVISVGLLLVWFFKIFLATESGII